MSIIYTRMSSLIDHIGLHHTTAVDFRINLWRHNTAHPQVWNNSPRKGQSSRIKCIQSLGYKCRWFHESKFGIQYQDLKMLGMLVEACSLLHKIWLYKQCLMHLRPASQSVKMWINLWDAIWKLQGLCVDDVAFNWWSTFPFAVIRSLPLARLATQVRVNHPPWYLHFTSRWLDVRCLHVNLCD